MTELELFVELLDNKSSTYVINEFKENVPGFTRPPLAEKKKHILRILKKQTNRKKAMQKEDPFIHAIKLFKISPELEKLDEEDFFLRLGEEVKTPEYVKLANAILLHPVALKKRINELVENFKNKRPIFEIKPIMRSLEDSKAHFLNVVGLNSPTGLNNIFNNSLTYLSNEQKNQLSNISDEVGEMSFPELQYNMQKLRGRYPPELIYYAYGLSNIEEDAEINKLILLQFIEYCLVSQIEANATIRKQFNNVNNEVEYLRKEQEKMIKLHEENKRLSIEIGNLNRIREENLELNKRIINIELEVESIKRKHQTDLLLSEKRNSDKLTNLQTNSEEKLMKIKNEKESIENEMRRINSDIEEITSVKSVSEIAVIHNSELSLLSRLFPEILMINLSKWDGSRLLTEHKNIRKIYIQRNGVSTRRLQEIRLALLNNDIELEIFFSSTPKDFLEILGKIRFEEKQTTKLIRG